MLSGLWLWMIKLFWDINFWDIHSYKTEGFVRHIIIIFKALALATVFTILAKLSQRNIYSVIAPIFSLIEKVWQTSTGSCWMKCLFQNLGNRLIYNYQHLNT